MSEEEVEKTPRRVTLESLYQITQIVAFVFIIASLFAIYSQINQAEKMERATAERDVHQRVADYARDFEFEEADYFLLGLHDWDAANYQQRFTVDKKMSEFLFLSAASYFMHQDGLISESTLSGNETYLISVLRTPGGQTYWAYKQHRIGAEYAAYLNARIEALAEDFPDMFQAEPHLQARLDELLAAQEARMPENQPMAQPDE